MDQTSRIARLAVFGGSFDPLHNGHLYLAGEILRKGVADEVLFVPAANPPHKLHQKVTSAQHRLNMLAATLQKYTGFSYTDIELQRDDDEPSYTIDTLDALRTLYTDHQLLFVMGMDSLRELYKWHRAPELVRQHQFVVLPRPDTSLPSEALLAEHFGRVNARKLLDSIVNIETIPAASTQIRECLHNGQTVAGLVPQSVMAYIDEHDLYQKTEE